MPVLHWLACRLQGEGGKKAGAVATVLAAVDHARVRKPAQAERGAAEEATLEFDMSQQQAMYAAEQQVRARTEATLAPPTAHVTAAQKTVHVSQVRICFIGHICKKQTNK